MLVEGVASHFESGCEGVIEKRDRGDAVLEVSMGQSHKEHEQTQAACPESRSICLVSGVLSPACCCTTCQSQDLLE